MGYISLQTNNDRFGFGGVGRSGWHTLNDIVIILEESGIEEQSVSVTSIFLLLSRELGHFH